MALIQLTHFGTIDPNTRPEGVPIWLNPDHVASVSPSQQDGGGYTLVTLQDGTTCHIQEPVKTAAAKLGFNAAPDAPVPATDGVSLPRA